MSDPLCIFVEVPVCAFRPYASREYQDTFPVPAPSSVYGMLLSLVGVARQSMWQHSGAAMALAVESLPLRSKVFRKLRRGSDLENSRPDYQDVLTDLKLWVWIDRGTEAGNPCLGDRIRAGLSDTGSIVRSGGLSLGESSYLVDAISLGKVPPKAVQFIVPDASGFYSLPVWVDHLDSRKTVCGRFRIDAQPLPVAVGLQSSWFCIGKANDGCGD